jgi:hypothetical protein
VGVRRGRKAGSVAAGARGGTSCSDCDDTILASFRDSKNLKVAKKIAAAGVSALLPREARMQGAGHTIVAGGLGGFEEGGGGRDDAALPHILERLNDAAPLQQHHDQLLVRVHLEQHVERKLRGAGVRLVNCSAAMSLSA